MPRGNPNPVGAFKPGHSKVGGRKTGGKNKKTVEREIVQQYQAATVTGKPPVMLGKDILSDMANYFYRRMGHYQPGAKNPNTGEKTEDPKMFLDMATMARDCAAAVANYESPKLRAHFLRDETIPGAGKTHADGTIEQLPPSEIYRMMLQAGVKLIEAAPEADAPRNRRA